MPVHARGEDRESRARTRSTSNAGSGGSAGGVRGHYSNSLQGRRPAGRRPGCCSICCRSCRHLDAREHIGEERPLQQALRRVALDPARQQVEQHVVVELAGGGAVAAAHVVGVDLKLRAQVDLRARARRAGRAATAASRCRAAPGATTILPLKATRARPAAMPRNSLLGARARRAVLDQREAVLHLLRDRRARRCAMRRSARSPGELHDDAWSAPTARRC